jgi:hypothetical protein
MIGKTVLQFATRRQETSGPADAAHRRPFVNKRWFIAAAAMFCLTVAAAFVFSAGQGGDTDAADVVNKGGNAYLNAHLGSILHQLNWGILLFVLSDLVAIFLSRFHRQSS